MTWSITIPTMAPRTRSRGPIASAIGKMMLIFWMAAIVAAIQSSSDVLEDELGEE